MYRGRLRSSARLTAAALAIGLLAGADRAALAQTTAPAQVDAADRAHVALASSDGSTTRGKGLFFPGPPGETVAVFLLADLAEPATVAFSLPGGGQASLACAPFRNGTTATCTQTFAGRPVSSGAATVTAGGRTVAAGSVAPGEFPVAGAPPGGLYSVTLNPTSPSTVRGSGRMAATQAKGGISFLWAEFTLTNVADTLTLVVPMANGGFTALPCAPTAGQSTANCTAPLPVPPALDFPVIVLAGDQQVATGQVSSPR